MQDDISAVDMRYTPLWPGYLAAFAERKMGPEMIEFRLASGDIRSEIEAVRPEIIAIGAVSRKFNAAIDCARTAKQYSLPTIVGGIHISLLPECLTKWSFSQSR
jgi:hypothetical protein